MVFGRFFIFDFVWISFYIELFFVFVKKEMGISVYNFVKDVVVKNIWEV